MAGTMARTTLHRNPQRAHGVHACIEPDFPPIFSGDISVIRHPGFALRARVAVVAVAVLVPSVAISFAPSARAQQGPVTAPSNTGNPNLAIATVKLENGTRVSRILGSAVYIDANTQIGTVDDLIMTGDQKIVMAVISVGGFLGVGGKLVAIPFPQLKFDGGKTMLPGATKDSLNAMPNFTF
jgi:hypothetical protein